MLGRIARTSLLMAAGLAVAGVTLAGYATYSRNAAHQPAVRIKYFGDSTIWGTNVDGSGDQYRNNPPRVLERELRARCGLPVVVENDAVPGTFASQLLYGTDEYLKIPFDQRMARSAASLVIFNFGMNDAAGYADAPSYRHHLSELTRIATEHGKQVVLESPNPALPGGVTLTTQPAWLASLIPVQQAIAAQYHVPLVDQYHAFLASGADLSALFPDGIHPTEAVAAEKARRVADAVEPMICPQASRLGRWVRLKADRLLATDR